MEVPLKLLLLKWALSFYELHLKYSTEVFS